MNKINCLIVDDEPLALRLIEGYATKTPFLDLKAKCSNAFEALEKIKENCIELVFLDVQMPDLNGIELARILNSHVKIIFTTAFSEYALDGFKVDALDYLLKPFNYEEFFKAANKAKTWFDLSGQKTIKIEKENFIFIKSEYNLIKVSFDDIMYIEGLKDYVKIFIRNNPKPILTRMNLKGIEEKLDPDKFIRVQKSFIVSIAKIDSIRKNRLRIGKSEIPFSDHYVKNIQNIISQS